MLELLNIRISFLLRSTHTNSEGKHPIILRLSFRKERRDLFTGLYSSKDDWDPLSSRMLKANKKAGTINNNLDLIQRKAHQAFEQLKYSTDSFSIDELVDQIKGKEERPTLLMDYLESEKERLKKRLNVDIASATYDKYRRSASHVQDFLLQEYKVKNYSLQRIDASFLEKYLQSSILLFLRPFLCLLFGQAPLSMIPLKKFASGKSLYLKNALPKKRSTFYLIYLFKARTWIEFVICFYLPATRVLPIVI
jgi:hypothetical protein